MILNVYMKLKVFGLVILSENLTTFGNFSNQQETRQDSVSHQFKSFQVLQWPLKNKTIGIPFKSHLNALG
jgi:hypothetical protein